MDVERALAEITREPAKELIKLELQRCDELMSAHYANACDGDVTATNTVLRVMAHRAMLMGWSRDQQGAARVVISDGTGVDGANRRLELEFVLPGKRIADMADLDANPPQPSYSPSPVSRPVSSSMKTIDGVVNRPTSVPSVVPFPRKPGSWMD